MAFYEVAICYVIDLTPVRFDELDSPRIRHDLLKEVQALAELKSGRIAVASGSGLHLLASAGAQSAGPAIFSGGFMSF